MSKLSSTLNPDIGILFLRIATGGLMVFHGIGKLIQGHDFVKEALTEKGLPSFLWIGAPIGEILAPILLILGIFSRLSGLMIAAVMVFALYVGHGMQAFTVSATGGLDGELAFLYMFSGIAIYFMGGGKYVLYKVKNDMLQ